MDNQDVYRLARNYMVTNAVIGSAASKMAQLNREQAAQIAEIHRFYAHYKSDKEIADQVGRFMLLNRKAEAFAYLNNSLRNEMIHDCQNQKEFTTHLSELIECRKDKYRPFYEKIDMQMPEDLDTMTAEDLCFIMSVELLSPEQLKEYHRQKEEKESGERLAEDVGLVFRAILIIGMLILMIFLSAQ
jgi:hypothetical protein